MRAGGLASFASGLATTAAVLLALAPVSLPAADIFPPNEPRQIFTEDASGAVAGALPSGISRYAWSKGSGAFPANGAGSDSTLIACGGGFWGTHLIHSAGRASAWAPSGDPVPTNTRPHPLGNIATSSVLAIDQSVSTNSGYLSTDWTSFRFEFDFHADANAAVGVTWGGEDTLGVGTVNHGYLFYIDEMPTQAEAVADADLRARWHLVRRQSGYDLEIDSGDLVLGGTDDLLSVYNSACYRLRLDFFCGTLRLKIARINCGAIDCAVTQCGGGTTTCSPFNNDPYGSCPLGAIDWCTVLDWFDSEPSLVPGIVGPFAGGISATTNAVVRFDNLVASTWDYDCANDVCVGIDGVWSGWTDDWDSSATDEGLQEIDLKYLYTGSVVDYAYGGIFSAGNFDCMLDLTVVPSNETQYSSPPGGRDLCAGWTVLHGGDALKPVVDLPSPTLATSNLTELLAYLEPMSSSTKLVYDATALPEDRLSLVDDFDNARLLSDGTDNPGFDPSPLPTWGSTPINTSLTDAYNWYVNQRTVGEWRDDPLVDCRLWYVIFITDGEERCPKTTPELACAPNESAWKFAHPTGGVPAAKVHTVGFSASAADVPVLDCIADETGGRYFPATDAGELYDVLNAVFNFMQETDRAFIPFAVSPPPPSAAGQLSEDEQFLTVFPHFVPINERSIWDGDLWAFAMNTGQTSLPTTDQCVVDSGQVVWTLGGNPAGAAEILADQMDNYTTGTPTRFVFMGSDLTGSWTRYAIEDLFVAANATLRTEFKGLLDMTGGASDLEMVEVVNFVRNIHVNPAALSLPTVPVDPPRPSEYSALGDIYHSQPVIVSPPNNFRYFSDYGLGPAHDYLSFRTKHAKRRRVVLAGSNDGMLHAFDGGFYDRDETNFDDLHDLGTGKELFAWVPQAVSDKLPLLTYGNEQSYTVDGPISVADVFIDHDGDSSQEWRTVAMSTMRRGGRGVVALDITTPDPVVEADDWAPPETVFPGCLDGTATDCDGEYPYLLWEFHDVDGSGNPKDDDGGCAAAGLSGAQCRPYWDLGWTWSKPAIARIGVYYEDGGGNVVPDDVFIAYFGGGWDPTKSDLTGNYFYGVNIETGEAVVKELIGVSVPASPAILDSDNDGYHDRIYFGDTNGSIWRLQFPSPFTAAATGAGAGTLRRIFDVSGSLTTTNGRQQFFFDPVIVPVIFDGVGYVYALAMGTGDRADLGDESGTVNHFFVVLDDLDNDTVTNPAYDESNLVHRVYDRIDQ